MEYFKKYCVGKLGPGVVLVEYLLWILKINLNLGIADLVPYNYFLLLKKSGRVLYSGSQIFDIFVLRLCLTWEIRIPSKVFPSNPSRTSIFSLSA